MALAMRINKNIKPLYKNLKNKYSNKVLIQFMGRKKNFNFVKILQCIYCNCPNCKLLWIKSSAKRLNVNVNLLAKQLNLISQHVRDIHLELNQYASYPTQDNIHCFVYAHETFCEIIQHTSTCTGKQSHLFFQLVFHSV